MSEPSRLEMLRQLRDFIEIGPQDWSTIMRLEQYFFGHTTGCKCKTNTAISGLNNYYYNNKKELDEQ